MLVTIEIDTDEVGSVRQWSERLHYDERTLGKFRGVLEPYFQTRDGGVDVDDIIDRVVCDFQNAGLLVRELLPVPERTKS